jgi:hypothetical protein
MGIVKAIQKNYEFKNLTNINNKWLILKQQSLF